MLEYVEGGELTNPVTLEVSAFVSSKDEGHEGVKVEIYTNDNAQPLVTLTKDKEDGSSFSYSDDNSQVTNVISGENAITLTLGGADDAKDYINNDALKIVVSDVNSEANINKYYVSISANLRLEPLNPFVSEVLVKDNGGLNDETRMEVKGTELNPSSIETMYVTTPVSNAMTFTALNDYSYLDLSAYSSKETGGKTYVAKSGYSMCGLVKSNNYSEEKTMYSPSDKAADYVEACDNMTLAVFEYNNLSDITEAGAELKEKSFSSASYSNFGSLRYYKTDEKNDMGTAQPFYLVSYDKPAFNLSAATALRHQSYAYYTGDITPKDVLTLSFKKIYDTTFHDDAVDNVAYYGATFEKTEGVTSDINITVNTINDQLNYAVNNGTAAYYPNGWPTKYDHVLYIDASVLDGFSAGSTNGEIYTDLRKKLAANAMLYVPNTEVADTNVVKLTDDGFEATENIRFIDKQPMFIPTDFKKPSGDNSVEYVREFTTEADGRVGLNTFVLPMALPLTDGVYDGNLKLYTLKESDCLTTTATGEGTDYYDVDATFTPVTGSTTEANTPYLAVVQTAGTEDGKTFTIKLTDEVEIVKTGTPGTDGVAVKGGASTGSVDGASVNFTSYGTYSGAALPKDDGYFYFGKDKLYKSNNLADKYPNVLMYPFRVYYDFAASETTAKKLATLGVNFDGGEATGISDVATDGGSSGITVSTGKGTITVTALTDTDVAVYGVSGQCIDRRGMASGESRTIATGSGIYLVNGKKVIVK